MKIRKNSHLFTLVEVICAIVILSFSLTSIVISINQNMIKVITSGVAIKCVLAAQNKLAEYRMKNWSEIPPQDSGFLMPEESESYKYEMTSELVQNEYGSFVHIIFTTTFPASRSSKSNGFVLQTDIALPANESKKIEEAIKNSELNGRK